jgi:hypothetical protein
MPFPDVTCNRTKQAIEQRRTFRMTADLEPKPESKTTDLAARRAVSLLPQAILDRIGTPNSRIEARILTFGRENAISDEGIDTPGQHRWYKLPHDVTIQQNQQVNFLTYFISATLIAIGPEVGEGEEVVIAEEPRLRITAFADPPGTGAGSDSGGSSVAHGASGLSATPFSMFFSPSRDFYFRITVPGGIAVTQGNYTFGVERA